MHVDETPPDANEVGWFVARQPGLVRFLEERCGQTDAFPVALEAAYRLCSAVGGRLGVPVPTIPSPLLERADDTLDMESLVPGGAAGGCADRQPELCEWVAAMLADPPIPLREAEICRVGVCLTSVIYALDELTTGRPVP